jgi:hypothetical protein
MGKLVTACTKYCIISHRIKSYFKGVSMVGIFLSAVYAIFAHIALGLSFGNIYLNATKYLFYWFAACGVATTLGLIILIVAASLGLSFFNYQIRGNSKLAKYGATLSGIAIVSNIFKYALLLFGTYLLHSSYYEGGFHNVEFAIGFFMVFIGIFYKSPLSKKKRYGKL